MGTAFACGSAMMGCNGDNGGGGGDSGADAPFVGDSSRDVTVPDAGDAKADNNAPETSTGGPCAAPTFSVNGGTVMSGTAVTVTAAGLPSTGVIYFTTDGTLPTTSSLALQSGGMLQIKQSEELRAVAFAQGVCSASSVTDAMYTVVPVDAGDSGPPPTLPPCPTPTFAPADGTTLTAGQNVVISATGLPAGGYILYTTDNTLAARTSPIYNGGTVGLQVPATATIHAISTTLGAQCTDSPQAVAHFTVPVPEAGAGPAVPSFSPTGTSATQANDFTVSLSDTTSSATICYTMGTMGAVTAPTCTTSGATAVCSGGTLTYSAPITVSGAVTNAGQVEIDAVACVPGAAQSAVAKSLYTLQAATPTMLPAAGTHPYSSTLTGSFASTTTGANIDYTLNGAVPSCTTPVAGQLTYAGPFALQTGTYVAVACKTGYLASAASAPSVITVDLNAPIITPAAGTFSTAPTFAVANSAANPTGSWLCSTEGATPAMPVCGTTANTCTTGTTTTPTGLATGASITAIACAPVGLSNSTATTVGPYDLVLGQPTFTANGAAATTSVTIPPSVTTLVAGEATGNVAPGWFCFQKDAQIGSTVACGTTTSTCSNGTPTSGDLTVGPTAYAAGDNVTVVACPSVTTGASVGYAPSAAATLSFVGTGTASAPTITPTTGTDTTVVTPVIANVNNAPSTLCFTTDSTTPTCTAGSTATNCKTVDGLASQAMAIQVNSGGSGYVNPPTVTLTGGGGTCTGTPTATLTAGAVSAVAVTGCSGYTSSPTVTFTPGSVGIGAITATASETINVTVTNGGSGYTSAPTVSLKVGGVEKCGTGGVTCSSTLGSGAKAGQVISVTVTGWSAPHATAPIVAFSGGAGTGAAATATTTQSLAFAGLPAGSNYTVAPVVTLTGGGGTCTSTTAALGTGANAAKIASVTSTGCSGFTGNPTVTVALQQSASGTTATAVAVASSMWAIPSLQANTVVKADACNGGQSQSANTTATYTFDMAAPTITSTAGNTTSPLNSTNTVTIKTTSNFSNEFLVYTTNGTTMPACSGPGAATINGATTVQGNTTTITPAPNGGTAIDIQAIACGPSQAASGVTNVNFTGGANVAFPYIRSTANGVDVTLTDVNGNPQQTQGTLTVQNAVSAVISNPNTATGSFLCYSTSGASLTCACNATGATMATAASVTIPVTTSGSQIQAIACATDANGTSVDNSATSSVAYDLTLTPSALTGSTTDACPASYTLAVDGTQATPDGPTTGTVTMCYGFVQPTSCAGGTGITCTTTGTAAISYSGNSSTTFFVTQCKTGFDTLQQSLTISPLLAYTPPAVVVDGSLSEWTSSELVAGTGTGVQGGFTYATGTDVFVGLSGVPVAANDSVVVYLASNKSTTSDSTTTAEAGTATLPFAAAYAVEVNLTAACSSGGVPCTINAFSNNGTTWSAIATTGINAAVATGPNGVEVAIPISALFSDLQGATTVSSAAALMNNTTLTSEWPANSGAWGFISDSLTSCVTPASSLQ